MNEMFTADLFITIDLAVVIQCCNVAWDYYSRFNELQLLCRRLY